MAQIGRRIALPHGAGAPDTRGPSRLRGCRMKALAVASAFALFVSIPLRAQDAWIEQRTVPDDASAGAQFGCAASLDGTLALIGADGENGSHGRIVSRDAR